MRKKRKAKSGGSARTPDASARAIPAESPSPLPSRDEPPSHGRRRVARVAGVVALAAVIIGAGALWMQRDRSLVDGAPNANSAAAAPARAEFVGGKVCAECHAKQYDTWRGSDHDLAMQVADEKSVLGNFADARFAYAGTTSRFFRRDGKFFVSTDGPDGKLADYEIKYTFGVRPLQQYLVEFPGGRLQPLGIAWDSRPKEKGGQRWFHLYPGQNIRAGDPLHWTGSLQNWNFQCAECHSTNLRKNFDAATDTSRPRGRSSTSRARPATGRAPITWAGHASRAIGRRWRRPRASRWRSTSASGVSWQPAAESGNAQRSAPRTSAREVEMCARCHGRASRIADDYVHGASPLDSHRLSLLDEGLYWNDGQMRDEVYNWGSFVQSRMYAKGVTCSDCHDPHSLALRASGNAVCAPCHQPAKYDAPTHTHHPSGTAGAACTACHMPATTYMVVDPRHDHSLRIPRPDLSVKLGRRTPAIIATRSNRRNGRPTRSPAGPASRPRVSSALRKRSQPARPAHRARVARC